MKLKTEFDMLKLLLQKLFKPTIRPKPNAHQPAPRQVLALTLP